ncbi:MAG TPA: hypothetical protein VJY34_25510 [Roseiarcus sp.]|nr:hypothetical protein [Roseiarcus sp.]
MGVVGCNRSQPAILIAELIQEIEAVAAVCLDRRSMVVNFDRVRGGEGASVLDRQLRPGWMSDGDEGAGLARPGRQPWPVLVGTRRWEVEWQAGREDVPQFPCGGAHGQP